MSSLERMKFIRSYASHPIGVRVTYGKGEAYMKIFRFLVVSMLVCTSVGCATSSDVRIAKNEALDAAAEANRKADEALAVARDARRLAQEADSRSARSEEMINRGFKRAMYK